MKINTLVEKLDSAEILTAELLSVLGATNKEIAYVLGVGEDLVKKRLHQVMIKTGTFTRMELALKWNTLEFQCWMRGMRIR